jgi:hypothetical protein
MMLQIIHFSSAGPHLLLAQLLTRTFVEQVFMPDRLIRMNRAKAISPPESKHEGGWREE